MEQSELIDIIIKALEKEDKLLSFKKYQCNRAVQIILKDGDYFNILPSKVSKYRISHK